DAVPLTPVAPVSDAVNLTWANVPVRSPTVIIEPDCTVTLESVACPLPEALVVTEPTFVPFTVTGSDVLAAAPLTRTVSVPAEALNDACPVAPLAFDRLAEKVAAAAPPQS